MFESLLLIPKGFMLVFFFIYGAIFGSFANVLIYRMQKKERLDFLKTSYCPKCFYRIPFYLNIPIFSWFFLKGLCRNCKKPISFRYPLVEFLMAILFSALFFTLSWEWFLLEALIFSFAIMVAIFIDFDQMILPDSLTLSGICIGLLGAWLNPERLFLEALLGAFFGGAFLLCIAYSYYLLRRKEGLGGGDIKMLAWIGALLGWKALFFVILSSCVIGSLVGVGIMLRGNKIHFQMEFPFGPYLALSAWIYIFLNEWAKDYMVFFMPLSFS